jgi:hypothetical protein
MKTYRFRLTDDLTVPVEANSREEAVRILKSEIAKKEASPLFDSIYFDYETGINVPRLRQALARQEKREEKENVLRAYVDSTGFTRTTKGDFAITPEGQRVLIEKGLLDEDQQSDKNIVIDENKFGSAGDYADFAGAIGPIAGAIAALSPQGRLLKGIQYLFKAPTVSRSIASGIGAAGGKAAEESVDVLQGFQDKDAGELANLLKTEFAIGVTGQGLGELGAKALGAFFGRKAPTETIRDFYITSKGLSMDDVIRLDKKLGRTATEKEINQAVKRGEVKELGFKAIPTQRALGREIPGRMQAAGETIFGKVRREQGIIAYNMAALNQLKRKIADQKAKLDEYSIFSETDSKVISELKAKRTALEKADQDVTNELNKLMNDLASETGGFSSAILQSKKELGENVQTTIKESYKTIQDNHRQAYGAIEERIKKFNPDFKIDMSDINRYIKETLDEDFLIAARADDANFKIITALVNGLEKRKDKVTLNELIKIRKDVRSQEMANNLDGGSQGDLIRKVYELIDEKINELPNNLHKIGGTETDKKKLAAIINDLKKENGKYYKNHLPFDNAVVRKIMSDTKVDSDDVYNAVFGINKAGDMKAIIQALPEAQRLPARQKLLRRYMQEKSKAAVADPITGIINPARFANMVLKDRQKLEPLLGNRSTAFFQAMDDFVKLKPNLTVKELETVAAELSGRIPQLEATTGAPQSFVRFIDSLKNKAKVSAEAADMQKARIFDRIDSASPEEVVKIVFRPKSSEDILRVKNAVTADAFTDIQEQALDQILRDSVQTGSTKLNDIFKPGNLERALTMYGDDTLEAMFGKDLTLSLKNFSRTLRATAGETGTGGAGTLVAGTLALNVFNVALWPMVAALGFYKQVFSNPRIVSALAKQDKNSIVQVLDYFAQTITRGGFRDVYLQTLEAGEEATEGLRALEETEEGQSIRGLLEESASELMNLGREATQPRLSADLGDLPDVTPAVPTPGQAPVSQSLLGGSPANIDIAQRLQRLG